MTYTLTTRRSAWSHEPQGASMYILLRAQDGDKQAIWLTVISDHHVTPWTVAHEAPLSTEFSRQEY